MVWWMTDLLVAAPDGIRGQAMDSTVGSIHAEELDTEDKKHLVIVSVDMNQVANRAEGKADLLDNNSHGSVIGLGELPDSVLGVGVDQDGKLHLALEFVEKSSVLRLGEGILVSGDVVDVEAMLLENVLAFCSLAKIIIAEVNATSVHWNTAGEASILEDSQQGQDLVRDGSEEVDTYELHLVLDTEQFMVHVKPSVGTIG
jgi:hypothetical protein